MDTELDRPSQGWRTRKCVATRFIFTRLGNNFCRAPRCLWHPLDFLADAPAADQHRVFRLPLDLGNVRHEHIIAGITQLFGCRQDVDDAKASEFLNLCHQNQRRARGIARQGPGSRRWRPLPCLA